jgi:hypothetical protein
VKALFPHFATTRDVTVRVSVSFLPEQSEPGKSRWFWAYHIRIENQGAAPFSWSAANGPSWTGAARAIRWPAREWSANSR